MRLSGFIKWFIISVAVIFFTACTDKESDTGDTTKPVITLSGKSTIELMQGTTYNELGATATDNVDGNLSVTISGTVDKDTVDSYTITYTVKDKAGNEATLTRTVNVVLAPDTTKPVITLDGNSSLELTQGTDYSELGAIAIDDRDGNLTVTMSGTVDKDTVGDYTITYTVTDSAGNTATLTRIVSVVSDIRQRITSKSFSYDNTNRVTKEDLGDGKYIEYIYDDSGNLVSQTVVN